MLLTLSRQLKLLKLKPNQNVQVKSDPRDNVNTCKSWYRITKKGQGLSTRFRFEPYEGQQA
jgi:hypothetical protein